MDYDLLILGGGPGGYVAAIRAAQLGANVGLIEERELGGTCLNRGCIPTKALIESTHVFSLAQRGAEFGVVCSDVAPNYARMAQRKDEVCDRLRKGIGALLKKNKITVMPGRGNLADRNTIEVTQNGETTRVTGENIIVATGSEPLCPEAFPFDGATVLTSDDALRLEALPKSILIVGGMGDYLQWPRRGGDRGRNDGTTPPAQRYGSGQRASSRL